MDTLTGKSQGLRQCQLRYEQIELIPDILAHALIRMEGTSEGAFRLCKYDHRGCQGTNPSRSGDRKQSSHSRFQVVQAIETIHATWLTARPLQHIQNSCQDIEEG